MASRFHEPSDEDVQQLKVKSKNKNTDRSTNVWVRAYEEWRTKRSFNESLEQTPPDILNKRLEQIYAELRKKYDEEYEPTGESD